MASVDGEWAKVRYQDRTGYMMVEYLEMDVQEPPTRGVHPEALVGS